MCISALIILKVTICVLVQIKHICLTSTESVVK